MSAAPETKYTDRDVRENRDLIQLAEEYVENYEGEFQYLIDCKMRLAQGVSLTTGLVRGILNCMRVDPRAPEMPEPLPPVGIGEVIQMDRPRRKKFVRYEDKPECPLYAAQIQHTHKRIKSDWPYKHCSGWYRINRESYALPATVKTPFLVARGGKMIHKTEGEGYVTWYPEHHDYGFLEFLTPMLSAKVQCMYPRWISQPILLFTPEASFADDTPVPLCKRCFPEGE